MKYLMIGIILSVVINAAEINKIEALVDEIKVLRENYDKCIKESKIQSMYNNISGNINSQANISKELKEKKMIQKYKKLLDKEKLKNTLLMAKIDLLKKKDLKPLKTKEKNNNNLINDYSSENTIKEKVVNSLENKTNKAVEKEIFTKASTYKIIKSSNIYNAVNGKVIYNWEPATTFTSNIKTQNWVKITGCFVNDKWQRAKEKLWIKKINIEKR